MADEMRKYSHLYEPSQRDFKDVQKISNSRREIASEDVTNSPLSSLPRLTGCTDCNLFLLHLLLFLHSKIKFKMSSSSAKSNVSHHLAFFHEMQVLPADTASIGRSLQLVTMETTACTTDSIRYFVKA